MTDALHHARMVIGGELVDSVSGERMSSTNPFTGEEWATVPRANEEDVDRAVSAARDAFENHWRHLTGKERARHMYAIADILEAHGGELAEMETTDNGKVIRETKAQMTFSARVMRFFAGCADKITGRTIPMDTPGVFNYTVRRPYGVVGAITAWNSPIALLHNKLPAALAAGNTVVAKPSEHASVTTCEFARLALEAGLPPGVFNVVTGDGPTGDALTKHSDLDKLTFTGSPYVGSLVARNAAIKGIPVTLELGGKSPNIIFEDANLDMAVTGAVAGIFAAAGQTCIAGSRLLVHERVYDEVVERLNARAAAITLGNPLDETTEMGPVANQPQFDRIMATLQHARDAGANIRVGGTSYTHPDSPKGLFISPTVVVDVSNEMEIAQHEIFGPVLSVLKFSSEEEAIRIANDTEFGLAAGIWTTDLSRAHRVVEAIDAGMVWVNTYRASGAQAPFGGTKRSGHGRERGEDSLLDYTWIKNVMLDYSGRVNDPFVLRT